ncbi:MAG: hypothetical protein HY747_09350 [Elusimicrobia bacterium]|nr:hypothetical protein [Elusimicrobiota bacterium]
MLNIGRKKAVVFFFVYILYSIFNIPLWAAISSATLEVIGMYHVPQDAYQMVQGLGIEAVEVMVQNDQSRENIMQSLDLAQKSGLKVFFNISAGSFETLKILPRVEFFKKHPAISWWYIVDEPDINNVEPDIVVEIGRFIHTSDQGRRPTFITLSDLNYGPKDMEKIKIRGKSYSYYKDAADVIGVLRYENPRKLRIYLESFVFPEFKGRRWWAIVSLKQSPKDLKKSVELFLKGKPAGILYYAYVDEGWLFNLKDKPEIQKALREINYALRGKPLPKEGQGLDYLAGGGQAGQAPGMSAFGNQSSSSPVLSATGAPTAPYAGSSMQTPPIWTLPGIAPAPAAPPAFQPPMGPGSLGDQGTMSGSSAGQTQTSPSPDLTTTIQQVTTGQYIPPPPPPARQGPWGR